jgi:hypothetical protein
VECPVCGDAKVEKALMRPQVAGAKKRGKGSAPQMPVASEPVASADTPTAPVAMISPQEREARAKLKELRDHLTKNSDNVGRKFPDEARKMHSGDIEHRSIYGEASPQEAKELHDEGIEFYPLPVLPEDRN